MVFWSSTTWLWVYLDRFGLNTHGWFVNVSASVINDVALGMSLASCLLSSKASIADRRYLEISATKVSDLGVRLTSRWELPRCWTEKKHWNILKHIETPLLLGGWNPKRSRYTSSRLIQGTKFMASDTLDTSPRQAQQGVVGSMTTRNGEAPKLINIWPLSKQQQVGCCCSWRSRLTLILSAEIGRRSSTRPTKFIKCPFFLVAGRKRGLT